MKKDIVVDWLTCPCGSHEISVNTEGDKHYLFYGDKITCLSCGRIGIIETDDCCVFESWDEDE
ncbi:hypothetical protein ESCOMMO142B_15845 [Escherichia coli]|nr:hypothetical protein LJIJOHLM_00183 [Escherichia phage KKP 3954]